MYVIEFDKHMMLFPLFFWSTRNHSSLLVKSTYYEEHLLCVVALTSSVSEGPSFTRLPLSSSSDPPFALHLLSGGTCWIVSKISTMVMVVLSAPVFIYYHQVSYTLTKMYHSPSVILSFSFFLCSTDHERDWPPCKVDFLGLATNALNVRNNNAQQQL